MCYCLLYALLPKKDFAVQGYFRSVIEDYSDNILPLLSFPIVEPLIVTSVLPATTV